DTEFNEESNSDTKDSVKNINTTEQQSKPKEVKDEKSYFKIDSFSGQFRNLDTKYTEPFAVTGSGEKIKVIVKTKRDHARLYK
ncbi:MAG: hypothetical protein CL880_04340, partial [Dehalococcoidia bacterium]|nr:hypothetical protein [Dehalococcoidia bacterium]